MVVGPFVQGLEYATGATAEVVGKPEKTFFHEAIQNLDVSPHNTVMIGDVRLQFLPIKRICVDETSKL